MAFDQSRELQSLASSTRSEIAKAMSRHGRVELRGSEGSTNVLMGVPFFLSTASSPNKDMDLLT